MNFSFLRKENIVYLILFYLIIPNNKEDSKTVPLIIIILQSVKYQLA